MSLLNIKNLPTSTQPWVALFAVFATGMNLAGCTGSVPDAFRYQQQEETFSSSQDINTKIDLLWVVDNSASMDASQQKLRAGFQAFAQKYMKPTWDIRVAVITTDTYMANSAFSTYLSTNIAGSTTWQSSYLDNRSPAFVNPSWNITLVDGNGMFPGGVKNGDLVPVWRGLSGYSFARLVPGLHDGPITGFCFEPLSFFYGGATNCRERDLSTETTPDTCINPGSGQDAMSQCVNTIQNNTVRSGKAIISTMPPVGTAGDAAWVNQLTRDFMVNATTGSVGHGSERGLGSVLQLIEDNESTATAFFRKDSVRTIIFVSDEEDQTMAIPSSPAADFNPWSDYKCDQASLSAWNPARNITGMGGYCCDDPAKGCRYGAPGITCQSKTIDGYTYTPSVCPDESKLMPVADIKTNLDDFFLNLDENATTDPNYFVVSIVPLTGQAIQDLQAARDVEDATVGNYRNHAADRGDRYLALGDLVGNGSLELNIADNDYSAILEAIGRAIIEKRGSFNLDRPVTNKGEMSVWIVHNNGTRSEVPDDKYDITGSGYKIVINDIDMILSLASTDKITINYQPSRAF